MGKLIFVDHSYHEKTGTTQFMQELLASRFQVQVVWDHGWAGGPSPGAAELDALRPDAIVFFQSLPRPRVLRALRCRNLTWVPMRDGLDYRSSRLRRLAAAPLKVLNFCREAHGYFAGLGMASMHAQYWPPPLAAPARVRGREPALFFWPRRQEVSWQTLKALLGGYRPRRIVLRYASDPGHAAAKPDAHDLHEYKVTLLEGWMAHDDYLQHLAACDLFMAPRPNEGIGMAMLEAMNHGLAVIAPDAPTMNEYVQPNHNGWLYDLAAPAPLDFGPWAQRAEQARADVAAGHVRWLAQAQAVTRFVAEAPPPPPRGHWRLLQALGL
jgi:glycosyltransferase involved in cell wall biosynthesis